MRTSLKNLLKLVVAALLLWAVGGAVILFSGEPAAPVAEAQADIAMLNFAPKSQQQHFVEGLQELGMEKPRSYDWNGNKVFFSMMYTKDSPLEVMHKTQAIYKRRGLNKLSNGKVPQDFTPLLKEYMEGKSFKDPVAANQILKDNLHSYSDFMLGGVVPIEVTPEHVMMAGGTHRGDNIKNVKDYFAAKKKSQKTVEEMVKSMQFIEATREKGQSQTLVTAVWSDDDLDMRRFINKGQDGGAANPEFPACPGCTPLMTFVGESEQEKGYVAASFVGVGSKDTLINFYDRSLGARGWRRMDSSLLLEKMRSRGDIPMKPPEGFVGYARGDKFMTLDISPHNNSNLIQLMQSP